MSDETIRPDRRVARGQRVSDETEIDTAHDGKQRVRSARRPTGVLPRDVAGGAKASLVTTEDVVRVAETPPTWEAREDDGRPNRPGAGPAPK